jgi:single-strand DNA-binding protein
VQTSKYTNKEGKTIYQTDLVCDEIEFPPVRKDEESTPVADSNGNMSPNNDTHSQSAPDDSFMNIPDDIEDSLPFR